MKFLALVLSLPTENATLRMRAWRALKALGAAALRDGVYLLPDRPDTRAALESTAAEVQSAKGSAHLLPVDDAANRFAGLFDRTEDYAALASEIAVISASLSSGNGLATQKAARKLRKSFATVSAIDYFPGEARTQTDAAFVALEQQVAQMLSPDEPHFIEQPIERLDIADYKGRTWATRRRPWVDRLASAWLIRRFIDPHARILWVASPADCPGEGLGFDFDGATFTHVGGRVTFEVLAESFGLDTPAIHRVGDIVHFLDVGGLQPAEAAGLESVLKGMRDAIPDDDQLLAAATFVFDGLLSAFTEGNGHG
jgi:hypothetical protein